MQNHTQQSKNADFFFQRTSFDPPPSQTNIVRLKQNAGNWRRSLIYVYILLLVSFTLSDFFQVFCRLDIPVFFLSFFLRLFSPYAQGRSQR